MTMISRLIVATDDMIPVLNCRIVGADSIAAFRELLHRGANCWDTAPAEVKELVDLVIHGKLMQDYQGMEKVTKKTATAIGKEFYKNLE